MARISARPDISAEVHKALSLYQAGRLAEAVALISAIKPDKRDTNTHLLFGRIYSRASLWAAVEQAYRAALVADRHNAAAAEGLASVLNTLGRGAETLKVTTTFAVNPACGPDLLYEHAEAQRSLGMLEASLETCLRIVKLAPASAVAEHNVAARLGDLRQYAQAQAAAERAFAKGSEASETWLVYGRALQGQDRYDEAEAAYQRALAGPRPCIDAHLDLAQSIWMRTGDAKAASKWLDQAMAATPDQPQLAHFKSKLLDYTGDKHGAYQVLVSTIRSSQQSTVTLELQAADAALALGDLEAASFHAERVRQVAPEDPNLLRVVCDLYLALGRGAEAIEAAERLYQLLPMDRSVLARLATAWRLTGDDRYGSLYAYGQFVKTFDIETPDPWADLPSYLADLATSLEAAHGLIAHPLGQSLRGGSQTLQNLLQSQDPAIAAFFAAIDAPIRQYIAQLGRGREALRQGNLGGYQFSGAWSVHLRPGGFHTDHVHPKGWLSSAFYVDTPSAVEAGGREGWLKFGQPGIATLPALEAEHWVKPQPGRLVLFPSYMWHGTVPFTSKDRRLSIAFDLVPDRPRR